MKVSSISGKRVIGKEDFYSVNHNSRRLNAAKAAMQYEAEFKMRIASPIKPTMGKKVNQRVLTQNYMP